MGLVGRAARAFAWSWTWLLAMVWLATPTVADEPDGVVVAAVAPASEAERAGLRPGDVLLRWTRGDANGPLTSPFDVTGVVQEQSPRGTVVLEGLRDGRSQAWTLLPRRWGLTTRPGKPDPVWSLFQEAKASAGAKDWTRADAAHREALDRAGPLARRLVLSSWAGTFERRDLSEAEKRYQEALAAGPEDLVSAWLLLRLGRVAVMRGDFAEAEEWERRALDVQTRLAPGSLDVAASLNELGNLARKRGDLARAEALYEDVLRISTVLDPGTEELAGDLDNVALAATERGDLKKAGEYNRQALRLYEAVAPGSAHHGMALNNAALISERRGDLARAEEDLRRALEIKERLAPGTTTLGNTLNNLGIIARKRGEYDRAEQYYRRALEIKGEVSTRSVDTASTLANLGSLAGNRKDNVKAEDYFRQALSILDDVAPEHPFVAVCHDALGGISQARGDLAAAESHHRRALAIRDKAEPGSADQAQSLAALGGVLRDRGQAEAAADLFARAVDALERQMARLGGTPGVRDDFRAEQLGFYRQYIDLLLAQGDAVRAFEVAERSRAQSLRELLAEARVDVRRGADPRLLEKERALQRALDEQSERRARLLGRKHTEEELVAADKDVERALRDYQRLESEIREASPAYAALTRPQPLRAAEIQRQLLDPDTLLLEYVLDEERSHLWCVTQGALTSHVLPRRADVEAAAQEVYRLLTARNQVVDAETAVLRRARLRTAEAQYAKAAAALSRMVLGPVAGQLQGKRLLVVADGALQYVPFEALPAPDAAEGARGAEPEPLVARHEIVYLPSASTLAMLRDDRPDAGGASKTVAVLADPVFDRGDARVAARLKTAALDAGVGAAAAGPASETAWAADRLSRSLRDVGGRGGGLPRLRFTRREAEAILAVIPSDRGLKAVDFMASRATATSAALREYRFVHFATHGMLDSLHPELSGLVLSLVNEQGQPQNGYLDLQDVYNLDLPAELVVLSACETGLGRAVSGEGLVGLTRGFMYAGARRVVASLWKVDDVATAELMGRFYRAMVREGRPPAAALRQAKVDMWKQGDWRSPYYWAAFEMQGEWR